MEVVYRLQRNCRLRPGFGVPVHKRARGQSRNMQEHLTQTQSLVQSCCFPVVCSYDGVRRYNLFVICLK